MLKRKSIRTKLVVALALFATIVLLLATSGFWGLHRYRQLARAISQRSMELHYAYELNQSANDLQSLYERIYTYKSNAGLRNRQGLIEADVLSDPLHDPLPDPLIDMTKSAESDYELTYIRISERLQDYLARVESWSGQETILPDKEPYLASLNQIRVAFQELAGGRWRFRNDLNQLSVSADRHHASLVDETSRHLLETRLGMEQFSDEIRGQCNAWMLVAWISSISACFMMILLIAGFRSLVVKPFRTLLDGSRLVAGGQFNHRIDLGTGDELSELAEAMNEMTDRFQRAIAQVESWCNNLDRQVRERSREVIQNEQLASVGFLAAGVAHEINNPLASIAWSAESLQSRAAELTMLDERNRILDDELCEALVTNLRRIEEEAYRCKGITEKLLDFSRLSEVRRASTDLSELVKDVVLMVGKVGKYRCKTIRVDAPHSVVASVNPQEIRQVVLNLVTNALESLDCDGAVDVSVTANDQHATIVVQDNGCGMTPEVLKHLFEPFFTRRRDGSGTGLGLSITYRIVSQHGGSLIALSDGVGRGSRLEMQLPLTSLRSESRAQPLIGRNHDSYQAA